jgi:formylglycine-generating enzyme required for sulfatase activity
MPNAGSGGTVSGATTREVGFYPPNAWGLYDMHGNAAECCRGSYFDDQNGAADRQDQWMFVLRGGAWTDLPMDIRCATRNLIGLEDLATGGFGFRLVSPLPEKGE